MSFRSGLNYKLVKPIFIKVNHTLKFAINSQKGIRFDQFVALKAFEISFLFLIPKVFHHKLVHNTLLPTKIRYGQLIITSPYCRHQIINHSFFKSVVCKSHVLPINCVFLLPFSFDDLTKENRVPDIGKCLLNFRNAHMESGRLNKAIFGHINIGKHLLNWPTCLPASRNV